MEEELKMASDHLQSVKQRLASASNYNKSDVDELRQAYENFEVSVENPGFISPGDY